MVTVKLYGQARRLTGTAEVRLGIEGPIRLEELLRRILQGQDVTHSRYLQAILINGRNCIFLGGLDAPVQDGDTVEILPMVSGGSGIQELALWQAVAPPEAPVFGDRQAPTTTRSRCCSVRISQPVSVTAIVSLRPTQNLPGSRMAMGR